MVRTISHPGFLWHRFYTLLSFILSPFYFHICFFSLFFSLIISLPFSTTSVPTTFRCRTLDGCESVTNERVTKRKASPFPPLFNPFLPDVSYRFRYLSGLSSLPRSFTTSSSIYIYIHQAKSLLL